MNDLYEAAFKNDSTAITALVAAGADPNAQHPRAGTLPLQLACEANAIDAIETLLKCGAHADAVFSRVSRVAGREFGDHTPLMCVKSMAAARLLLDAGAAINRADNKGWTALVCAAHGGDNELVAFLLKRGASSNVQLVHDGKRMNLVEFLASEIDFLNANAASLNQPAVSGRVAALSAVRATITLRAHV